MFRHAELEQPAPYLIRGHPDIVPTKVGTGMTILPEGIIYKQTLRNYSLIPPSPRGREERSWGQHSFYLIQALFQFLALGTKLQRFFLHLLNNLRRSFGKKLLV